MNKEILERALRIVTGVKKYVNSHTLDDKGDVKTTVQNHDRIIDKLIKIKKGN